MKGKVIGVDARKLESNKAGIGNYTYNLIKEILRFDQENKYILYTDKEISIDFKEKNLTVICLPDNQKNKFMKKIKSPFWQNIRLRKQLMKDKVDIFFSPNFFKPILYRGISFLTIHDLTFITVPKAFSTVQRWYNRVFLYLSLLGRVEVFTVSNHSKNDILRIYRNVPKNKVHITYCAVDTNKFKPLSELNQDKIEMINEKYNLPDEYLLFVGTIEPRKNLKTLINVISVLKKRNQFNMPLLICGSKGAGYNEILMLIEDLNLYDLVRITGYVEDDDLPYLYARASLFVYPSIYEGFGIPPLEAMASGVPVVTSKVSSLPEVVGNAAICIDPYDQEEMAARILEVLDNESLRDDFIKKGLLRSSTFKWSESAQEFINVLNKYA